MTRSELADRFLTELKSTPGMALCPKCAGTQLGLQHWDVMKLMRELIGAGLLLCSFDTCPACGKRELITVLRHARRAS